MRNFLIGLAAFLTLVDLFATQAILPALAKAYGVAPAAMGLAVNASTLGMAVAASEKTAARTVAIVLRFMVSISVWAWKAAWNAA